MTDNTVNITNEPASNADSFRAELNKLQAELSGEVVESVVDDTPQDIQDATTEDNSEVQDDAADSDELLENPQQLESEPEPEVETKGHLIPKSRFNQEIEKRKSLEEQLTKEREDRIRIETQLAMLNDMQKGQSQQQSEQQFVEDIDPLDTDTYNYAKREIEALKAQLASVTQETQQRTTEMQMHSLVSAQEAAFTKQHPDFNDAMKHVQEVEFNIAKEYLGDERAASEYVGAKLRDALTRSLNSGKNAAETIYNMAKTYGYNATKTPSKTVPTKDLEAIERNRQRSANTGNLGNSSGINSMPTDIRNAIGKDNKIIPDEFHKLLANARQTENQHR